MICTHKSYNLPLKEGVLALGPSPLIMGILNATPDSFSDGGEFMELEKALRQVTAMLEQGADIIDIGGQSTRPGAQEITTDEELSRTIPIIEHLMAGGIKAPISIDTFKAEIAEKAVIAGASIINDVTGLTREPDIAEIAVQYKTPLIIMHWDKERDDEKGIIDEMKRFFDQSIRIADNAGLDKSSLILDPGFGFAKTLSENYQILNRVDELEALGYPLLIGTSRKSMLGKMLGIEPKQSVAATAATSVIAYQKGAHIFRVHDVAQNYQALQVAKAAYYGIE